MTVARCLKALEDSTLLSQADEITLLLHELTLKPDLSEDTILFKLKEKYSPAIFKNHGIDALVIALGRGFYKIAEYFVKDCEIDVTQENHKALFALVSGDEYHGVDEEKRINEGDGERDHYTIDDFLQNNSINQFKEMLDAMIEAKADITAVSSTRGSVLCALIDSIGSAESVGENETIREHCDLVSKIINQLLESKKIDVNIADEDHATPLYLAMKNGLVDLIAPLISQGAKPAIEDANGELKNIIDEVCNKARRKLPQSMQEVLRSIGKAKPDPYLFRYLLECFKATFSKCDKLSDDCFESLNILFSYESYHGLLNDIDLSKPLVKLETLVDKRNNAFKILFNTCKSAIPYQSQLKEMILKCGFFKPDMDQLVYEYAANYCDGYPNVLTCHSPADSKRAAP